MNKVIIWKPGLSDGSENELPNLGMGILATSIRMAGDQILFMRDNHFTPSSIDATRSPLLFGAHVADYLCLSLASQEWHLPLTQSIIDHYYHNGCKIILGGPHAYSYGDLLETDPRLHKIVIGEVDGQWPLVTSTNARVIRLPHPDHLLTPDFTSLTGHEDMTAYPLYTSRGCTNQCNFCVGSKNHGQFRIRSLDDVFKELEFMKSAYPNVKKVYVVDDCFTGDLTHAKVFLHGWNMNSWRDEYQLQVINVRADQIDPQVLYQMRCAHMEFLPIGVESADPTVFKHVGKGETLADIEIAISMIQSQGLTPWLNMIVGLPYDTPAHHRNSMEWAIRIPKPVIAHWFQMAPFRRTRAFRYFHDQGIIPDDYIPAPYGRRYSDLPWESDFGTVDFTSEERMVAHLEAYLRCHSPVLINAISRVESLVERYNLQDAYEEWWVKTDVEGYTRGAQVEKKRKGQI